ncbi:queuine tRNA-ribosyltransferase [Paenibacillus sp. PR3]|uniref:Queuine tRNA-ribosyltransferase n=1 Tax=Paenibacillus terricola TaxID=2763503 RepID=A0ABR8N0Y4_9BACL|nr:queuine tRNA-ribosyltransferase [Paenibacillus terricola]
MEFYVGWSHSDAIFSNYFSDCPMLVSAVPDNRGTIKRFLNKPKRIMIDCGSVYYVKQRERPKLKDIFNLQLSIVEECDVDIESIQMVHFDEPMMNKVLLSEKYMAMERTLFNAYEYINLFKKTGLPNKFEPVGVIQGYDLASITYSAYELVKMGFKNFAIGSLLAKHYKTQIDFIKCAADIVGANNLHVFGVTGIPQMHAMVDIGVRSFDSTRPTMAAVFFQVFYSRPFRTYIIEKSHAKPSSARLNEPLPCDCPICLSNPADLFIPSPRDYSKLRSIHNYYHLRIELNDIRLKKGGEGYALSNVLRT